MNSCTVENKINKHVLVKQEKWFLILGNKKKWFAITVNWLTIRESRITNWNPDLWSLAELIFFHLWPFLCCHYIFDSYVPTSLLVLTVYAGMCASIHMNFLCLYSLEQQLFQSHSNLLEPKNFLRGLCLLKHLLKDSKRTPDPPAPLTFGMLALPLMFIPGVMPVLYLILFPPGFSAIHNKLVGD